MPHALYTSCAYADEDDRKDGEEDDDDGEEDGDDKRDSDQDAADDLDRDHDDDRDHNHGMLLPWLSCTMRGLEVLQRMHVGRRGVNSKAEACELRCTVAGWQCQA